MIALGGYPPGFKRSSACPNVNRENRSQLRYERFIFHQQNILQLHISCKSTALLKDVAIVGRCLYIALAC